MDIRQLRYLVALAEERNFTRAAEREHIAQPALSQQIRKLEDEVGLSLVERTTRRVSLTEAGEQLLGRARRILLELQAAKEEMQALRGVEVGHVTVGAIHTIGPIDVALALALFHQRHPAVELTVREHASEELAEMVRHDVVDMAFLSVTERMESHGLALHQLLEEELVAVLPPGHRLADQNDLDMGDLRGEHFISFRAGSRLRELLFSAAREAGYEPQLSLESNATERIRRLVSRGMGVAILPRSDAERPGERLALLPIRGHRLTRDITLAWREDRRHSPAAWEFLRLSQALFTPERLASVDSAPPARAPGLSPAPPSA